MAVRPFTVTVPPEQIADLRQRLASTRWPDQLGGTRWDYGTDRSYLQGLCRYWERDYDRDGYLAQPQTPTDSPAGLAGLIVERFHGWTHGDGGPDKSVPRDRLLDNISVDWLTGTIGSPMRLYHESLGPCRGAVTSRPLGAGR